MKTKQFKGLKWPMKSAVLTMALAFISTLGLISCSGENSGREEKVLSIWQIKPPKIKTYDNKTKTWSESETINKLMLTNQKLKIASTDSLVFDASEGPADLHLQTLCHDSEKALFKSETKVELKSEVRFYEFLPLDLIMNIEVLSNKEFHCETKILARSQNGSTHSFGDLFRYQLVKENKNELLRLEDEDRPRTLSWLKGTQSISIQRARYYFLPAKKTQEQYWLKCTDWESKSSSATHLYQLFQERTPKDNLLKEQVCRLFIVNKNNIINLSEFFVFQTTETKDFLVDIEPGRSREACIGQHEVCTGFAFNKIHLNNLSHKSYYFALPEKWRLRVIVSGRNRHEPTDFNAFPTGLKMQKHKSWFIFELAPLQKATVTMTLNIDRVHFHENYARTVTVHWPLIAPSLYRVEDFTDDNLENKTLLKLPLIENRDETESFRYAPPRQPNKITGTGI